jgi:acyl-coenzyme A thioesterase PaaI-like protein
MKIDRGVFAGKHAIFGVLMGKNMIEKYQVYKRPVESKSANVVVAHVKLGDNVDGHPGMVHGGILALILDDFLGFGFKALGVEMAVTANLSVDFRAPVFAGSEARIQAQLARREGRKLYWTVQMSSLDGKTLYAECTSLYIIPRTSPK